MMPKAVGGWEGIPITVSSQRMDLLKVHYEDTEQKLQGITCKKNPIVKEHGQLRVQWVCSMT